MVRGAKLRSCMSWIMRRRSGVMVSSLAEVRRRKEGDAPDDVSAGAGRGGGGRGKWDDQGQPRLEGNGGSETDWGPVVVEGASRRCSTAKRFRSTAVLFTAPTVWPLDRKK